MLSFHHSFPAFNGLIFFNVFLFITRLFILFQNKPERLVFAELFPWLIAALATCAWLFGYFGGYMLAMSLMSKKFS
jgi:hypothetical protein